MKAGAYLMRPDLSAVFVGEMGLGSLGLMPRAGGRWRVVTGERACQLRPDAPRWFCGNAERAAMLADLARLSLAKLSAPIDTAAAIATVQASAASIGVLLATEDRIRAQAEAAVRQVEQQFARLERSGELKTVNRAYREYRIAKTSAGEKAIGYPTFISNYKARMVRVVAQHSRITVLEIVGDNEK